MPNQGKRVHWQHARLSNLKFRPYGSFPRFYVRPAFLLGRSVRPESTVADPVPAETYQQLWLGFVCALRAILSAKACKLRCGREITRDTRCNLLVIRKS